MATHEREINRPLDLDALDRMHAQATPGEWGEDDGNAFSRDLANARTNAVVAKIDGKPFDKCALKFDAFIATTEQRHETSDADAVLIAALHNAYPALAKEVRELREECADHRAVFDVRWKADQRAIKQWRAEREGRDLCVPDHADLVVFLLADRDLWKQRAKEAYERAAKVADDVETRAKTTPCSPTWEVCSRKIAARIRALASESGGKERG